MSLSVVLFTATCCAVNQGGLKEGGLGDASSDDSRCGGATRGVVEPCEVWWSDAMCRSPTRVVVTRLEVRWSDARSGGAR